MEGTPATKTNSNKFWCGLSMTQLASQETSTSDRFILLDTSVRAAKTQGRALETLVAVFSSSSEAYGRFVELSPPAPSRVPGDVTSEDSHCTQS